MRRTAKFLVCPTCGQPTYTRADYARVRIHRLASQLAWLVDVRLRGRLDNGARAEASKKIASTRASIKRWQRELQQLGEGI